MKKWLYNVLIMVFAGVFLVSGGFLAAYFIDGYNQQNRYGELASLKTEATTPRPLPTQPDATQPTAEALPEPTAPAMVEVTDPKTGETRLVLPEFAALYELNSDIIGWMKIPGTVVDYPVMHTPEDPEHYLLRNFDGENSKRGCLFIQAECDPFAPSDNITIYGHHMRDGTMFGQLEKFRKKSFRDEHPYIYFDTLEGLHTYEIMAVFLTTASVGQGFPYHSYVDMEDAAAFDAFVERCQKLSLYKTGVQAQYGDKLICLSTCEYSQDNGRLVVVAKRIA